jgi:hypothetical protein
LGAGFLADARERAIRCAKPAACLLRRLAELAESVLRRSRDLRQGLRDIARADERDLLDGYAGELFGNGSVTGARCIPSRAFLLHDRGRMADDEKRDSDMLAKRARLRKPRLARDAAAAEKG